MYMDDQIKRAYLFNLTESKLKKPACVTTKRFNKFTFTDLIEQQIGFNQYFFLTRELLDTCKLYEPSLSGTIFSVVEQNRDLEQMQADALNKTMEKYQEQIKARYEKKAEDITRPYWKLDISSCLTTADLTDPQLNETHFFISTAQPKPHIIVSLYLCESILRRLPTGLLFKKLEKG